MSNIEKEFEAVVFKYVDENPKKALAAITGMFVSLTLELIEAQGHESDVDIFIDADGSGRNITIHALEGEDA